MKVLATAAFIALAWADAQIPIPLQEQQRSAAISDNDYVPFCSSTCYGQHGQSLILTGSCEKSTLEFLCSMSETSAKSRAKSSCGSFVAGRCSCTGAFTEPKCTSAAVSKNSCLYEVLNEFSGECSRDTGIIVSYDTLCAGTHEMIGSLSTPKCDDDDPDVKAFCALSADASKYKADAQCFPDSDLSRGGTSCQGDYTISRCTAVPGDGESCTVKTYLQYQGYCGTTPEEPTVSTPSVSDGLVIKKIYGHKIPVYITRRLPKDLLIRALSHIIGSQDMGGHERPTIVGKDWSSYYLGNYTIPYYRPDIGRKIPAYYEFEVFSDPGLNKPAGFIMITSSDPFAKHDEPIAHWNSQGTSITRQLLKNIQQTTDVSSENTARTVFWKLDSLSYVVSKGSTILSQIGNIPPVISGLTQEIFNEFSSPDKTSEVEDTPYIRTQAGPNKPNITFDTSLSGKFADYISSYSTNFQYHIEMLRTSVKQKWLHEEKGYQVCDRQLSYTYDIEYDCVDTVYVPVPDSSMVPIVIPFMNAVLVTVQDPNGLFYQDARFYKPNGQQFPILMLQTIYLPYDLSSETRTKEDMSATAIVSIGEKTVLRYVFILVPNEYRFPAPSWAQFDPISTASRKLQPSRKLQHHVWHYYDAGTAADQRCYNQYPYGGCAVGCGPVAWMMLFGWIDYRSSPLGGNVYGHSCTYRSGGISSGSCTANPSGIAPSTTTTDVRNAINNIRNRVDTFCIAGSGATFPWDMPDAFGYLQEMGAGVGTVLNWNSVGYHSSSLTSRAAEEIVWYGRPAIIGTGWLSHYPLAYRYAWKSRPATWWEDLWGPSVIYEHSFYINTGWGCSGNGWVGSGTWFAGRVRPP